MVYKIELDAYKGPLDLLLGLIEKAEIDIYDIPIASITEQFIEHVYLIKETDLQLASEFLVMVARLLEIKSKMLLPLEKSLNGDEEETDPREELVKQLLEYKKFKEVAEDLRSFELIESKVYYKPQEDLSDYKDDYFQLGLFDLDILLKSLNNIIARRGLKNISIDIEEIQREEFTLKECIDNIMSALNNNKFIKFSRLLKEESNINEIVTYFLSVLELVKMKSIYIKQDKNFADLIISIRHHEVDNI